MAYQPIRQGKVADAIVEQIKDLILTGVLRPDEKLPPERELAAKLDVSRPTLREAIHQLELMGLVEAKQGGGTFVRGVVENAFTEPLVELMRTSADVVMDYVEFRKSLEGAAAYHAALRATDADKQMLTMHTEAMEAAHGLDDPSTEAEADANFHLAVAAASHNVVILHISQGLVKLLRQGVFYNRHHIYGRMGARDKLLSQHRAIHDAILAGDPDGARSAARAHMAYIERCMREIGREDRRQAVAEKRLERLLEDEELEAS